MPTRPRKACSGPSARRCWGGPSGTATARSIRSAALRTRATEGRESCPSGHRVQPRRLLGRPVLDEAPVQGDGRRLEILLLDDHLQVHLAHQVVEAERRYTGPREDLDGVGENGGAA